MTKHTVDWSPASRLVLSLDWMKQRNVENLRIFTENAEQEEPDPVDILAATVHQLTSAHESGKT